MPRKLGWSTHDLIRKSEPFCSVLKDSSVQASSGPESEADAAANALLVSRVKDKVKVDAEYMLRASANEKGSGKVSKLVMNSKARLGPGVLCVIR